MSAACPWSVACWPRSRCPARRTPPSAVLHRTGADVAPPDAAPGWHPTASLLRATLASAAYAGVALLVARPDLLVLAAPLLVHAAAGLLRRPTTVPRMTSHL